jgi:hypothetical protein
MRALSGILALAALASAQPAVSGENPTIRPDQLGVPRANAPATASQVPQSATPVPRSPGAVSIPPAAPTQPRTSSANVPQAQGQVDMCERILLGQSPPVPGLDCTRSQLEALTSDGGSALAPRTSPSATGLDRTIDSIGRDPSATSADGAVPPIIILGPS